MNKARSISVVVTATDFFSHTPELFQSLDAQAHDDFHMIVVDDASSDGCELSSFDRAMVLRNVKPYGYARSMNQAIALSLARWEGTDLHERYVLFIHPEVILGEDTLRDLHGYLRDNPDVAAAGPKMYLAKKTNSFDGAFDIEFTDTLAHIGFGLTKGHEIAWSKSADGEEADRRALFAVSPDCFLIRASFLNEMKSGNRWLDERYSRIPALLDFFWHIRERGGQMRAVNDANAWKQSFALEHDDKKQRAAERFEMHEVHIKHSPMTLRIQHSPWLFITLLKRAFGLFGEGRLRAHLINMPYRFRLGVERRARHKKLGIAGSDMASWFL